jgi:thiol-disulfide isomerase/thioredoxin
MNINKLKNTYIMTNPLFIVIMLLLGLIIVLSVFRSASPFLSLGFGVNAHIGELKGSFELETFDNAQKQLSDSDKLFVMYYAEWCGHCKKTMPEFENLINNYKGNIKIIVINSEDEEYKNLVKSQNIKGFPTIRYYSSGIEGVYQEYNGGRTEKDFAEYLSSV